MATTTKSKKDPLAAMRAFVARQAGIKLTGCNRSRDEELAALIAEQAADDSPRIPADGYCTRNLPSHGQTANWAAYHVYRS